MKKNTSILALSWLRMTLVAPSFICLCLSLPHFLASAHAQEQDYDFVDALAPIDASASAFHSQKFNEAEKALMEGLSRNGSTQVSPQEQPQIRPVSATQPQPVSNNASRLVETAERLDPSLKKNDHNQAGRRVGAAEQRASGVNTQLLTAINSQTQQRVAGPKPQKEAKQPTISSSSSSKGAHAAVVKDVAATPVTSTVTKQMGTKSKDPVSGSELRVSKETVQQLRRELADAKNQLAAAEIEITRLSTIIQQASRARLSLPIPARSYVKEDLPAPNSVEVTHTLSARQSESVVSPDSKHDLHVATISVDKADLRLGPGRNHSALMSLRRGSRLAVEARQGEWYRVFAPNGQRAWIHASLIRFGEGASSLNDGSSAVVKGYDGSFR